MTFARAVHAARGLRTDDTLSCGRDVRRRVRLPAVDHLVPVKAKQPVLRRPIGTKFAEPPGEVFATAVVWGKHGDRVGVPRLRARPAQLATSTGREPGRW